jgi:hypothetical protein
VKVAANLGKTLFEMEDSSHGVLKITRTNSDGVAEFFVPVQLVLTYAVQRISDALPSMLLQVLR